eukprot:XP_014045331.1 PREDICTED: huntingtin-like [Salmo salar]
MSALGHFANDGEVKVLLKSLVVNLKSTSPTIRRTAASSAASMCQHSRRASYFYTWLLNVLLGQYQTQAPLLQGSSITFSRGTSFPSADSCVGGKTYF